MPMQAIFRASAASASEVSAALRRAETSLCRAVRLARMLSKSALPRPGVGLAGAFPVAATARMTGIA